MGVHSRSACAGVRWCRWGRKKSGRFVGNFEEGGRRVLAEEAVWEGECKPWRLTARREWLPRKEAARAMAARSADVVPTNVLHHVPPAANSGGGFAVNVSSLEGLHSLPLLNLRKPLLGYRSPSAPIEDLLAGSAAASSTPTPSLQQSKLASFFKKPAAEPPSSSC